MINRHPRRVLLTLAVLAVVFFALGGVLAGYVVAARLRERRTRAEG